MLRTPPVRISRRPSWKFWVILGVFGLPGVLLARPIYHLARSATIHAPRPTTTPAGYVDDASRLNRARVAEIGRAATDSAAAESQLASLLLRARHDGLKVSITGAQHTMGAHTIAPNGIVVDMTTFRGMSLSSDSTVLFVRAGTRWSEVIPFLDRYCRSLSVMQSNNSFTVGGSLSANAHGWQHDHPPMASMVRALRIMMADGVVRRASRNENRDLFRLTLGGYGLFGIILDAELQTVRNELFRVRRYDATSDHKELRWTLEKRFGELPGSTRFTRNQLLNEPAEFFANTSKATTDVLHEYFVPEGKLSEFVRRLRPVLVQSRADLLNVTIRNVLPDSDGFLAYARVLVWRLVMLFTQERTPMGDAQRRALTRQLVDAVLQVGRTYYLPYRLHASRAQFLRAYPMAKQFFALKRKYDPQEIFSNRWYQMYDTGR